MIGILLRQRAFPDDSVLTQSLFLQASHTCDAWLKVTQQYLAETATTEKSPHRFARAEECGTRPTKSGRSLAANIYCG